MSSIRLLKNWDEKYPSVLYDSKYVKVLLKDVFGLECLAISSVGGTMARNQAVQHKALDPVKLDFIKGKQFSPLYCYQHRQC